jgi:hypothetical protein
MVQTCAGNLLSVMLTIMHGQFTLCISLLAQNSVSWRKCTTGLSYEYCGFSEVRKTARLLLPYGGEVLLDI